MRRQILPALTGLLSCGYIFIANPAILCAGKSGMPINGVITATVLISIISTLLGGLITGNPYFLATGMGLNVSVAALAVSGTYTWQQALAISFFGGLVQFSFFTFFPEKLRDALLRGIPKVVRVGMVAGIAAMLARYALEQSYHSDPSNPSAGDPIALLLALIGFVIMASLYLRGGIKGAVAILLGMTIVTVAAFALNRFTHTVTVPERLVALPDFHSAVSQLDLTVLVKPAAIITAVMLALANTLDNLATMETVSAPAVEELRDQSERPRGLIGTLRLAGAMTMLAGFLGTSSVAVFLESIGIVLSGGRNRTVAILMAVGMIPFLFVSPLISLVPAAAYGAVLLFVAMMMFLSFVDFCRDYPAFSKTCREGKPLLGLDRHESLLSALIPTLVTIVTMQFFGGIGVGVMFGFCAYIITHKFIVTDWQKITPVQWGYGAVSVVGLVAHFGSSAMAH